LRGFPKGSRDNLLLWIPDKSVIASPPKACVAIYLFVIARAPVGSPWQSLSYEIKTSAKPYTNIKKEIATPERFSVQARNDRKDNVASLLAMTKSPSILAISIFTFQIITLLMSISQPFHYLNNLATPLVEAFSPPP